MAVGNLDVEGDQAGKAHFALHERRGSGREGYGLAARAARARGRQVVEYLPDWGASAAAPGRA